MKSTATNIEKSVEQGSLSWQPNGRCGSFTKEAILAQAPKASGVYSLFNVGYQIFIGGSANIQAALLHHIKETDFPSRHLQPTGFAFEICEDGLRESKAAELVAKYCPVLQNNAALTENLPPSNPAMVSKIDSGNSPGAREKQQFPNQDHHNPKVISQGGQFKRTQRVMFSAVFAASVVTVFSPDVPAVKNFQSRAYHAAGNPLAEISVTTTPASHHREFDWGVQNLAPINTAGARSSENAEPKSAKPDIGASAPNRTASLGATIASSADETGLQASVENAIPRSSSNKIWSVQISSAPAKDIADALVQRLKANGYDGYAVQAMVEGQPYYRVRVGRFDTREKAESLRLSLLRLEGYQEAYLTRD